MGRVTVRQGDLLESNAQTLVNTVNCVGVMGKGIALQFKNRFPDMFKDYKRRCDAGAVRLGEPYLWNSTLIPWVLNFPTKDHWRSVARLSDVVAGLDHIAANYKSWGINSLAMPPLGCGEGQLEWAIIGPTLYRELTKLDIDVELYAPFDATQQELEYGFLQSVVVSRQVPQLDRLSAAEVALATILHIVEREPYHWPVGRVAFQKIAYFATVAGIPTGLDYRRGSYGPFAQDLKKMQTRLLNHSVIREQRLGRMFRVHTGTAFEDAAKYFRADLKHWQVMMDRVADLFLRTNTRRAEILASAHYAAGALQYGPGGVTELDVVQEVLKWKLRRNPPLIEEDVAQAIRTLNLLGWTEVRPSDGLNRVPDFAELVG